MEEIRCPVCEKCPTVCYTVCIDCYERMWGEIAESRQKIKELELALDEEIRALIYRKRTNG